jgi:hypothetical protein
MAFNIHLVIPFDITRTGKEYGKKQEKLRI